MTPALQIQAQTNYADCILKYSEGAPECDTFPGSPKSVEAEKKTVKPVEDVNNSYHLLQPLTCEKGDSGCELNKETGQYQLTTFDPSGQGKLGIYLNYAIKLFIAICAVAAVVMITIGGIEWAGSELISKKEDGKQRIWQAVLGLILALSSYLILYTINPDLLNTDVDVGGASVRSEGEITIENLVEQVITVGGPITDKNISSVGTHCDANVIFNAAQSAGRPLTTIQAATMGCIGGAESGGCKNVKANVTGVISSAAGPFQILGSNKRRHGDTTACKNNPNSLECHATMAAGLLRNQTNYGDWLNTQNPCPNAKCVIKYDPQKIDRNVKFPEWVKIGKNWVLSGRSRNPYSGCGL